MTARPGAASWRPLGALATVCYLPLLLTQPGWVSADTKTYLYLDPGRLLGRAWSMWDPHVGLGTVSHQTIGYLWPMGPWFWTFDRLGVPDWLAQRLWWASILFAAGAGMAYLLRRFAWPAEAVWSAAFVYALSPYVLSLMGRLSAVLLPFAGLPWLIALTIQSIRHKGWRHPALFALTVTTVGSVNLTALVLVGVAPALWLLHAAFLAKEAPPKRVLGAALRMGLLTVGASAWWLAGLSVQATNGIDVVRYTETARVVSLTSSAQEVLRGLGYWFFYGGDKLGLWTEQSLQYTQRPWLLVVTFAIPALALVGAAVARWPHRAYFAGLVAVGTFLAVGAHPWDDPRPLGHAIKAFLGSERGLAFRSLPRAAPVAALGLAVLLGAGIAAVVGRHPRRGRLLALTTCALAVAALAPLWQGEMVAENLRRQDIPAYWTDAAQAIDARDDGTRVLELPGSDFAFYRWGMTVDPITPGLVDRPYVARELIPYGSPASADLLNAFDLRLQERTLDPDAIAPIARLLRAGDLVLRNDLQYERYNTPRPRLVWDLVRHAAGLGPPEGFGPATANEPVATHQLRDGTWLVEEAGLADPPPVALVPVPGAPRIIQAVPAAGAVLLSGDGAGIVDAAAAGVVNGAELVRYSASLSTADLTRELHRGAVLVVTDSNRQRGERWSTVRHTRGYTETADHRPLADDLTDNRLPVVADEPSHARTVAEHRGGITANATSYGNPIALAGEARPAAAVDGDPTTAWVTGAFSDARGERLRIELDAPTSVDRVRLLQPITGGSNRTLTHVRISLDGDETIDVALDERSRSEPGQLVTFDRRTLSVVEVELQADSAGEPPRFAGVGPVGFAEVRVGDGGAPVLDEVIRVPADLVERAGARAASHPLSFVFTRLRQDPTDTTRDDEERSIVRAFSVPTDRPMALRGKARLSARAASALLDQVLGRADPGLVVSASSALAGSLRDRPRAALDGDPSTAWTSAFGETVGQSITVALPNPITVNHLALAVVADGRHSVPTQLEVRVDGVVVAKPAVPPLQDGTEPGATNRVDVRIPATTGRQVDVKIAAVRPVTSTDWESGSTTLHPVAIAELGLPGVAVAATPLQLEGSCRADLVELDGRPLPVKITGASADALAGSALDVEACGSVVLATGDHLLRAAPGRATGIDLDQLVLHSAPTEPTTATNPSRPAAGARTRLLRAGPDHIRLEVRADPAAPGWLVLGQSHNHGWRASIDGVDLGPPQLVDGFANGWELPAGTREGVVDLRFTPQRRVDLALWISGLTVGCCLLLVRRRPRPHLTVKATPQRWSSASLRYVGQMPSRWAAGAAGAATTSGAALVAHPAVAVALGAVAALGCRHPGSRRAIALLPAALLAVCATYVVIWQVRHAIVPGIEWPIELDRAHPVGVLAVLLLLVDVLVDRVWSGPSPADDSPLGSGR